MSFNRASLTLISVALFLSACTNGAGTYGLSSGSSGGYNFVNGANGTSTTAGGVISDSPTASGVVALSSVSADQYNPSSTLDLIGDGTNSIGANCTSSSGTNIQGTGASTCQCNFQYVRSNGSAEQVYVDTTYHEANMIQCPYNTLPDDITTLSVSIHLLSGGQDSNSIAYSLTTGGVNLDLSLTNSFNLVKRYQCKDIVTIPYMGTDLKAANTLYDPIQSEDSSISYPLNFYTNDFGGTFALYAGSNIQRWNCPSIPNDTSIAGLDLRVFSASADNAGSKLIYPPAGSSFDRSTFYVARKPSGPFNIALNTYVAPQLYANGGGAAPVGYGAVPIATGPTTETCPDTSVTIPSGYHWAKLFLFRASLAARSYMNSAPMNPVSVGCNPGANSNGVSPAFADCGGGQVIYNSSNNTLADRVLGGAGDLSPPVSMCVNLQAPPGAPCGGQGPGCTTQPGGTVQFNSPYNQFGLGTDVWAPRQGVVHSGDATLADPMDLFGLKGGQVYVPKDRSPTPVNIDVGNPRYDFLFVVTPVSVMAQSMQNGSSSATNPYIPYRFPSKADCISNDPDSPTSPTDCMLSKKIVYSVVTHDISTNGDPSGSDPHRAGTFPMCVLQPN